MLLEDWSDADFLYISSICFSDSMTDAVFEKAQDLKPRSVIASLKLPSVGFYFAQKEEEEPCYLSNDGYFEYFKEEWYKMNWGSISVYFLRRTDKKAPC